MDTAYHILRYVMVTVTVRTVQMRAPLCVVSYTQDDGCRRRASRLGLRQVVYSRNRLVFWIGRASAAELDSARVGSGDASAVSRQATGR